MAHGPRPMGPGPMSMGPGPKMNPKAITKNNFYAGGFQNTLGLDRWINSGSTSFSNLVNRKSFRD